MIQLSYWLFPIVFVVFLLLPQSQHFLLPGLIAACVAGAANSAVVHNYPSAVGHALAAAVFLILATMSAARTPLQSQDLKATPLERASSVVAWAVLALVACRIIPDSSWPYALSKTHMMAVFIPFLAVGAVARRTESC